MQRRLGLDLEVPDEFGWMMTGYTVAEASFQAQISKGRADGRKSLRLAYSVTVRRDDKAGLEYIRHKLGVGKIYDKKSQGNAAPQAEYVVNRIGDLYHVIVPLFEKYPLPKQWRKAREFEVWKRLVAIKYHEGGTHTVGWGKPIPLPQSFWDKVEPLVQELKGLRIYKAKALRRQT